MSTLLKVARQTKTAGSKMNALKFMNKHKKRIGSAAIGAGVGAYGGNKYNQYSGEEDPGERNKNVGKGTLLGAATGALVGPKVPGAVKGTMRANRNAGNWIKRNKAGETNIRELAKDTAKGAKNKAKSGARSVGRGAKKVKEKGSEFLFGD